MSRHSSSFRKLHLFSTFNIPPKREEEEDEDEEEKKKKQTQTVSIRKFSLAPLLWHNRLSKTVTDHSLHRLGISGVASSAAEICQISTKVAT
jgi:hypothetical protein